VQSLQRIMRSNGWPLDAYSGGSPFGAICSRGDLSPTHASPSGCYDTKVMREWPCKGPSPRTHAAAGVLSGFRFSAKDPL
jgi:hypothetical protein